MPGGEPVGCAVFRRLDRTVCSVGSEETSLGLEHPSMSVKDDEGRRSIAQAGVVPYRVDSRGRVQILLITTEAGKWIVPKGHVERGHSAREAAQIEAMEEAGVVGRVTGRSLGEYSYKKGKRLCRVSMFAMQADQLLADWPEKGRRERKWLSLRSAMERVAFPDLSAVMLRLERVLAAA